MKEVQTGVTENGFTEVSLSDTKENIVIKGSYDLLSKVKNTEEGEEHGH